MTALRVVPAADQGMPSTRPVSPYFEVHSSLGISLINHLYNRLDGAYPGRWRKDFPDPQSIANWEESWVEAFEEEGITPDEVKAALREVRKRFAWPPSVSEFIQLARPPVNADAAYHEAMAGLAERQAGRMGEWSHPAIYWAAQTMHHDLVTLGQEQVKSRWKKVLADHMARKALAAIPAPALQLAAPGRSATEQEVARQRLADIKAGDIIKQPDSGRSIGWAHAILKRAEKGDPKLTGYIVARAQEALARVPIDEEEQAETNINDNEKGSTV